MNAGKIYELPINLGKFCDFRYVFSGSGYFRMISYHLLQSMYKKNQYTMSYFHPHDYDPEKLIPSTCRNIARWRRTCGVKRMFCKFERLLNEFNFMSVSDFLASKPDFEVVSFNVKM